MQILKKNAKIYQFLKKMKYVVIMNLKEIVKLFGEGCDHFPNEILEIEDVKK